MLHVCFQVLIFSRTIFARTQFIWLPSTVKEFGDVHLKMKLHSRATRNKLSEFGSSLVVAANKDGASQATIIGLDAYQNPISFDKSNTLTISAQHRRLTPTIRHSQYKLCGAVMYRVSCCTDTLYFWTRCSEAVAFFLQRRSAIQFGRNGQYGRRIVE